MGSMWSRWAVSVLLVGVVALGAAACDDEVPTTPNNPSNPVTETFSGSVNQNGAQTHTIRHRVERGSPGHAQRAHT